MRFQIYPGQCGQGLCQRQKGGGGARMRGERCSEGFKEKAVDPSNFLASQPPPASTPCPSSTALVPSSLAIILELASQLTIKEKKRGTERAANSRLSMTQAIKYSRHATTFRLNSILLTCCFIQQNCM